MRSILCGYKFNSHGAAAAAAAGFSEKKEVEKDIIPTLDGFSSFFSVVVVTPKR